jgi:tRNA-dihydrouridine synthase B
VRDIILAHLDSLYAFYGEETGVRIARKHLGWYCEQCFRDSAHTARRDLMGAASTAAQFALAGKHFDEWADEAAWAA